MTLNGAIMQLVEMRENSMMPICFKPYFDKVIETISECEEPNSQPKWIPCSERMPEEHDSIFSKFYGTEKWRDAMFRKTSKTVIITVEHLDGTRQTAPCHTIDGEWNQSMKGMGKVIAWMPLPECYEGD